MGIRGIQVTGRFEKNYRKLPKKIRDEAKLKENIFRKNPFDPTLKTHKLHGIEKEIWAFWVTYSYRIKFIFLDNETVLLLDIGTHEIYK